MTTKRIVIVFAILVLIWFVVGLVKTNAPTTTSPADTTSPVSDADEVAAVELYIKNADLAALVGEEAVLGGTLYTTEVVVDPQTDTAAISYEDGHIAGKGTLSYTYDSTSKEVTVNTFTKAQ